MKMENALYIWSQRKRVSVDSNAIREKSRVLLYGRFKQPETSTSSRSIFTSGKDWLDHFKRRFSLSNVKMPGKAASADQFTASSYFEQLKQLIDEKGFRPEQIFNADESALFWKKMPTGHMIKPGLIYKTANLRAIKHSGRISFPMYWMHNKKAWTTKNLFLYWFHRCFILETKQYLSALGLEFKVLLILVNATGHQENLQLENQGVIRTFKAYYTRMSMARLVAAMDEDSHVKAVNYWKKSSIADCLCLIKESVTAHAMKKTVTLEQQMHDGGFKSLQELEEMELIESHTNELTHEELVEMTASTDEENMPTKTMTLI
ncbi:Tigger transposable element-derived protein 1 [Trichinella zimbabwensis]|uniref:Tigger transposable element-derived protein 1 n=1 Tax=Trichinella zimbabwensis TaxID=268475 RepID=A0A0V1H540_9BILA|nr:Tigger transposable element-derived protein 1 [Trichinella zimbabwensis]